MMRWGAGEDGSSKKQGQIVLRFSDGDGAAPQMKMDGAVKLAEGATLKCTEVLAPGASQEEAWRSAVEPLVEFCLHGDSANILHMGEPHPSGRRFTLFGGHPVNDVHPLTEESPSFMTEGSFIRTLRALVAALEGLTTSGQISKIWTENYTLKVALCSLKGESNALEPTDMWKGSVGDEDKEYSHAPTKFFGCTYLPIKQLSHTLWTLKGVLPEVLPEETILASIVLRNKETGRTSNLNFMQPAEAHRPMFESSLQTWVVGMQARSSVPKAVTELFQGNMRFSLTLTSSMKAPSPSLKRLFVTASRVHHATQPFSKKGEAKGTPEKGERESSPSAAKKLKDAGLKVAGQQRGVVKSDEAAGMALHKFLGGPTMGAASDGASQPASDPGDDGQSKKNLEQVVRELQRQLMRKEGELLRVKSEKQQTDTVVGKHMREIQNLTKQLEDMQKQLASKDDTIKNLHDELDDMSQLRQLLSEANEQNIQLSIELQEEKKKTAEFASSIDDLHKQLETKKSNSDKENHELLRRIGELEGLNALLQEAKDEAEAARRDLAEQLKLEQDRARLLAKDVDGLGPFVEKYDALQKAFDALQAEKDDSLAREAKLKKRNDDLASDLASLQDELRALRNETTQKEAEAAHLLLNETEMAKELEKLRGKLQEQRQSTDHLDANIKDKEKQLQDSWEKFRDASRDAQNEKDDNDKLRRENEALQSRIEHFEKIADGATDTEREAKQLRNDVASLNSELSILKSDADRLARDLEAEQGRKKKVEFDLAEAWEKFREAQAAADTNEREKKQAVSDLEDANRQIEVLQSKLDNWEKLAGQKGDSLTTAHRDMQGLKDQIMTLNNQVATLQGEGDRAKKEATDEQARRKKLEADLNEAWEKLRETKGLADDLQRDKRALQGDLDLLRRENGTLKQDLEKEKAAAADATEKLQAAAKELQELQDSNKREAGNKKHLEDGLNDLRDKLQRAYEDIDRLKAKLAEEEKRRHDAERAGGDMSENLRQEKIRGDDLEREVAALQQERDDLHREVTALGDKVSAFERMAQETGQTLSEHDKELLSLRDALAKEKAEVRRLEDELASKRDALSKATSDLDRAQRDLADESTRRAKLEAELNDTLEKLREAKTRGDDLQRDVRGLRSDNDRLNKDNLSLQGKVDRLQKQLNDANESGSSQDRELTDLRDAVAVLKNDVHQTQGELSRAKKDLDDEQVRRQKLDEDLHESWEKLRDSKARADDLQRDLRNADGENDRLKRDNDGLKVKMEHFEKIADDTSGNLANADRDIVDLRDQLAAQANEMASVKAEVDRLRKDAADEQGRRGKLEADLAEAWEKLRDAKVTADELLRDKRNAEGERDRVQRDNDSYKDKVMHLEKLVADAGDNLNATDRDMLELKDQLLRETAQKKRLEAQCADLAEDVKELQNKLSNERGANAEAEQRLTELQAQLADAEHTASRNIQLLEDEKERRAKAEQTGKDLGKELRDLGGQLQDQKRQTAALERDLLQAGKDAETRLLHARHDMDRVAQDLADTQDKLERQIQANKELGAEMSALQGRVRDMKREIDVLEQEKADAIADGEKQADSLQREADQLKGSLAQEQERRVRAEADLMAAQQEAAELKGELTRQIRAALEDQKELEKQAEAAERDKRRLAADMEQLQDKKEKLENLLADQRAHAKELADELATERRGHEKTERARASDAADAERRYAALEREVLKLQAELEAEKGREQQSQERIKSLNNELKAMRDEMTALRRASAKAERDLQDQILDKEKKISAVQRDHERTKSDLEVLEGRLEAAEADARQKDGVAADLRTQVQEMKDEIDRLNREKLDATESASRQLASLAREKAQLESDLQAELDRQARGEQWSKSLAEELKQLRDAVAAERLEKEELERALAESQGKTERALAAAQRERETTDGIVTEYKKQLANADEQVRRANEEAAALKAQVGDLHREVEQLRHDADIVNASHDRKAATLAREVQRLEAELRSEEDRRQREQDRANALADEVRQLKARMTEEEMLKERELQAAGAAANEMARGLRSEIHSLEAAIEEEKRKSESLVADLQRMRDEVAAERKKGIDQGNEAAAELAAAQEQIHKETEKRRQAETDKDKVAWEASRAQAEAEAARRKAEDADLTAKHNEDLMNQALAKAAESERRRHDAVSALERAKHQTADLEEQVHRASVAKEQLEGDVARLQAELHERKLERERDKEEVRNMQFALSDMEKSRGQLEQKIESLEAELQRYLAAKADAEEQLKRLQVDHDALDIKNSELTQLNSDMRREAENSRKQHQQAIAQADKLTQKLAELEQEYRLAQDDWSDTERTFKDKLHTADAVVADLEQQMRRLEQALDQQKKDHDAELKRNREVERAAEAARATAEAARHAAECREKSAMDKIEVAEQRLLAKEREVDEARDRELRALQLAEAEKRSRMNISSAATEAEDEAAQLRRAANEIRDELRSAQRLLRETDSALKKAEQELIVVKQAAQRDAIAARDEADLLREQVVRERQRADHIMEELAEVRKRQQQDAAAAAEAIHEVESLRLENRRLAEENKALVLQLDASDQALADMRSANSELDQALHKAEVNLEGLRRAGEKHAGLEATLKELRYHLTEAEHREKELAEQLRREETSLRAVYAAITDIIAGGNGTAHIASAEVTGLCRFVKDLRATLDILERRSAELAASSSENKAALIADADDQRRKCGDLDAENARLRALQGEYEHTVKQLQMLATDRDSKHLSLADEVAMLRKALAEAEMQGDEYRRQAREIEDGAIHGIADVHDKLKDAIRRYQIAEQTHETMEGTIAALREELQFEKAEKTRFEEELVVAARDLEARARDVQLKSEQARLSQRSAENEAAMLRSRLATVEKLIPVADKAALDYHQREVSLYPAASLGFQSDILTSPVPHSRDEGRDRNRSPERDRPLEDRRLSIAQPPLGASRRRSLRML